MKIDFDKELTDFTGDVMKLENKPESPNLTLRKLAILAFKTQHSDDQLISYNDKLKQMEVIISIRDGVEITTEQATILKERICKCFPAIVVAEAVQRAIES